MRLIDADKLRELQFAVGDGDTHAVEAVVSLDDIDAQPVIACGTCLYCNFPIDIHKPCELDVTITADALPADFGCSLHEPKEQP